MLQDLGHPTRISDLDGQESGNLECLLNEVPRGFDLLSTTASGMYAHQIYKVTAR